MLTYFGTRVASCAKSRLPKSVNLHSWHIRTSTLIFLLSRCSGCACVSEGRNKKALNAEPPETFKPTGVEQFVDGFPQTTRPHSRQWCLRLEKWKGSLVTCQFMKWRTVCHWTDRMGMSWWSHHFAILLLFVPAIVVEIVLLWEISETRFGQSLASADLPLMKEAVFCEYVPWKQNILS